VHNLPEKCSVHWFLPTKTQSKLNFLNLVQILCRISLILPCGLKPIVSFSSHGAQRRLLFIDLEYMPNNYYIAQKRRVCIK